MTQDGWCEFKGFGQWHCDDAPCDYKAAFVVDHWPDEVHVCVRHIGYAIGSLTDQHDSSPRAIVSRA
jgi:hypothetical protein